VKVTVSLDFDGGPVRIVIECPPGTPPERAADAAWSAVADALTCVQTPTTTAASPAQIGA